LNNLGWVLQELGQAGKALPYHERALVMYRNLAERDYLDQAQALARAASLPLVRDAYLSSSRDLRTPRAAYPHVWASKAAVPRILQGRRAAARASSSKSPEVKAAWDELVLVRGQLTFRLNNPGKDLAAHDREVRDLTRRIEGLERLLGKALPELPRRK